MKLFVRVVGLFFLLFLIAQLIRPALSHPPVTAEIQAPPTVKAVLKKSCYSCHSNETALPWYDQVVPAYWLVTHDVNEARAHLNFSEIGKLPVAAQRAVLFEAVNQIQLGAMPLPRYLKVHPNAALSPSDLAVLKAYLDPFGEIPKPQPELTSAAEAQFKTWDNTHTPTVQPEHNGLAFFPDYKNWKAISTTDRGDNHTMRVITANEIAIHAIETHQINPWPDGSAFAKIAWNEAPAENGAIQTGTFKQVEFMVKDKTKYASTAGWGWGRWLGMDLKPYGKDAKFTNECVSCHTPVAHHDFVYTLPIERKGR